MSVFVPMKIVYYVQRRIFIFGALGYFTLGALLEGRMAVVTFSASESARLPKFLNPDPGPKNFQIRLMLRLRLPSMQPKFSYGLCFYSRNAIYETTQTPGAENEKRLYCRSRPVFYKFLTPAPGPKEKGRILPKSTLAFQILSFVWCRPFWSPKNWVIIFVFSITARSASAFSLAFLRFREILSYVRFDILKIMQVSLL